MTRLDAIWARLVAAAREDHLEYCSHGCEDHEFCASCVDDIGHRIAQLRDMEEEARWPSRTWCGRCRAAVGVGNE